MLEVTRSGRIAAHTAEAEASRSATQRRNALARWEWQRSSDGTGIDQRAYDTEIQPQLKSLTNGAIASAIGSVRTTRLKFVGRRGPPVSGSGNVNTASSEMEGGESFGSRRKRSGMTQLELTFF